MGCRTIIVDGIKAIVCDRSRPLRLKPCRCGQPGEYLCDWIVARAKSGKGGKGARKRDKRCNAPICPTHALKVAEDKHLCPEHQARYQAWLDRRRAQASAGDIAAPLTP